MSHRLADKQDQSVRDEHGFITSNNVSVQNIELPNLEDTQGQSLDRNRNVIKSKNPLLSVKAKLQVVVGELVLTVGELLNAKEHQVFELKESVRQPVELHLNGHVVARGRLVAVDGRFAVELTELAHENYEN